MGKGILLQPEDSIIADVISTFGQLVAKGDYKAALKAWIQAKGEVPDFQYWSNLGLVQLKLENYPEARYAFEKAWLKTIYSSSARRNIELIETKLPDGVQKNSWQDYGNSLLLNLGPLKLWILVLILILPLVWLIKKQLSRNFQIFTGVLILAPFLFAVWFQVSTGAFVALKEIELYDGPSQIFRTGRLINPGMKVLVREQDDWWYVVYPPAATGWVSKAQAKTAGELWGIE